MKKIFCFLFAATILAFSAAGCDTQENKLTKVRLCEVTHSIFYAPMYLALELGYFEEEGIEIELTNGGGADNCMTSLLSGSADVILAGPEASIYVINGGREDSPKVFAQLTKRDGSFLVSKNDEPDFEWTDLSGKEVVVGRRGGVPAMTFQYVVNNHNLIDGDNITLNYDIQFNLMAAAFDSGTGDYVTLFEPTASEFVAAGKGYIVASVGEESGEVPYTAFAAKKSYINTNRDTLVKFTTALQRAVKYMKENDMHICAEKIVAQFPDTTVQSVEASLESYSSIDAWMTSFMMTDDSLQRLQNIMVNADELEQKVTLEQLVDNTIAQEVYTKVM